MSGPWVDRVAHELRIIGRRSPAASGPMVDGIGALGLDHAVTIDDGQLVAARNVVPENGSARA